MNEEEKLVTKSLLTAFGERCKKYFKENPIILEKTSGNWIYIQTKIPYADIEAGFSQAYIEIKGDSFDLNNKYYLDSNFFINTNSYSYTFGSGINLGDCIITDVVLAKNEETSNVIFYLKLNTGINISTCSIDFLAVRDSNILFRSVEEIGSLVSVTEPLNYVQLCLDSLNPVFPSNIIGNILNQPHEDTQFTVVETKNSQGEIIDSKSYTRGSIFDLIFRATEATKLSHNLSFKYDFEAEPLGPDSDPVEIGNPKLESNNVVTIPIPSILANGFDSEENWINRVKTVNGVVVDGEYNDNIDLATINTIGGIKLGTSKNYASGDKVFVQLDSAGQAFIDKAEFDVDKHRDDLNKETYQQNKINFYGQIWQHIGETTTDFVNGYFYKCVKTGYNIEAVVSSSPYAIGTQLGTKLENYVYSTGSTLDLEKEFKLYVAPEDYPQEKTVEEETQDVLITELTTFKLINTDNPNNILTLSKEQLKDILDITIKTYDGWDTATTKSVSIDRMVYTFKINASDFGWKQWDVQPRTIQTGGDFEYITNQEIDYLFEDHAVGLIVSPNVFKGQTYTVYNITCSITPSTVDDQRVNATIDNTNVAIISKNYGNTFDLILTGQAGETTTITFVSVENPNVTQTYTITIIE